VLVRLHDVWWIPLHVGVAQSLWIGLRVQVTASRPLQVEGK
jgi:hypothetical protein